MKKILTLLFAFMTLANLTYGQTTLYTQTFESSYTDWSLNTTDPSGTSLTTPNYWVVNNIYAGSGVSPTTTPDQPSGITGGPESNYMHIRSVIGAANCTFNATGNHYYFTAMNAPIVTSGYANVNLSFWWLCNGNNVSYGQVFYRTSASGSWVQISTASIPPAALDSYNVTSAWTHTTLHLDSFDNKGFLELGFRFHHQGLLGSDPAFGVDEIKVTGTLVPPTPTYTVTASSVCQDSCITFTSTTVGTTDSIRWQVVGVPLTSTVNPLVQCFPGSLVPAGTYFMRLYAFSGGMADSVTQSFTINPAPHPTITKTGHVLSVPSVYTGYQWYNGSTAIAGATNASYTYTAASTYTIIVDSAGCKGTALVVSTVGIPQVATGDNHYWIAGRNSAETRLYAAQPIDESLHIAIYDATGRKIGEETWEAGSADAPINTTAFPAGLYIIKLSNSSTSTALRWKK